MKLIPAELRQNYLIEMFGEMLRDTGLWSLTLTAASPSVILIFQGGSGRGLQAWSRPADQLDTKTEQGLRGSHRDFERGHQTSPSCGSGGEGDHRGESEGQNQTKEEGNHDGAN